MFYIWSSQGPGWLLWISKMHTIMSLSMRNTIKFSKFLWQYTLKFIVMPNSYGAAITAFAKLLKRPFLFLGSEGYLSVIYVDD